MLVRSLRSLRATLSLNQPKTKSILLSYASPLTKYTFLGIPSQNLASSIHSLANALDCPQLNAFLDQVKSQLHILAKVRRQNYGFVQLHRIEEEQKGLSQILSHHSAEIKTTATCYVDLIETIKQSVSAANYLSWMEMCMQLNIIEIGVWKLLLKHCWEGHASQPPSGQDHAIFLVHNYLNQKFMKFTHMPDKFLYRENAMVDLGSLPELVFLFLQCLTKRLQINQQGCRSFRRIVELNNKLCKTTLVNFMGYVKHYKQHQQDYQRIIDRADIDTLIDFLRFFALIGYADKDRLGSLETKIVRTLEKAKMELNIHQATSVINSWSLLSQYTQETHQLYIKPTLLQYMQRNSSFTKWTTILFDLIAAGIDDIELFQSIITRILQEHPIDSKVMHIINHYLSVQYKINRLSSYPHCHPNQVAKELAAQCSTVYSNCLQRSTKIDPKKSQFTNKDISYSRQLGIEHNPPQSFWLLILQETFKQLSERYPHQKNAVYFNFGFCVFELDALVVLNQKYIAFELVGTHYMHKDKEESVLANSCQGKKNIRSAIIKAYGIKVCEINSAGLVERTISSFQDKKNGAKFVRQKLEAVYLQNN